MKTFFFIKDKIRSFEKLKNAFRKNIGTNLIFRKTVKVLLYLHVVDKILNNIKQREETKNENCKERRSIRMHIIYRL